MTTDLQDVEQGHHRDLAANRAGAAAEHHRRRTRVVRPSFADLVTRVVHGAPDERDWRVDHAGEQKVGQELLRLGPDWRVLHAVPVGPDVVDHLAIGPPGVFVLHTRRRPGRSIRVSDRTVHIDHRRTDHLHRARLVGRRASALLRAASGVAIGVRPVIVFVDVGSFEVTRHPADLHVTTRARLIPWLDALPGTTDPATIDALFTTARRSTTWAT